MHKETHFHKPPTAKLFTMCREKKSANLNLKVQKQRAKHTASSISPPQAGGLFILCILSPALDETNCKPVVIK